MRAPETGGSYTPSIEKSGAASSHVVERASTRTSGSSNPSGSVAGVAGRLGADPRWVIATLNYVKSFYGQTIVIKLGGAALQDTRLVDLICADLRLIQSVGIQIVLVHGGGPAINEELTLRGISWEFVEGQRVTTPQMMEQIEKVLCGLINRRIVRRLNHSGISAVGLAGSDAELLRCVQSDPRLGQVGKIESVNTQYLKAILATQIGQVAAAPIPVIAPVGVGRAGEAYNINADWAAVRVAQELGVSKLIFLTDQDGVLDGPPADRGTGVTPQHLSPSVSPQLIPELDAAELEGLIERGVVKGGMLAKCRTVLHALKHGVQNVHILNSHRPHTLLTELFTDEGSGTVCRVRSRVKRKVKNA